MTQRRYIALLRGVNVGGRNKLPMKDLRAAVEALGYEDVTTYIQSGNVVFSSETKVDPAELEQLLEKEFSVTSSVVLRTASELRKAIDGNPFEHDDPKQVYLGFMTGTPPRSAVAELDVDRFQPDQVAIVKNNLYLHLPNGLGRAKLPGYVDSRMTKAGTPVTVRNWATVTKLAELAGAP